MGSSAEENDGVRIRGEQCVAPIAYPYAYAYVFAGLGRLSHFGCDSCKLNRSKFYK
jgi:hypothetical protein